MKICGTMADTWTQALIMNLEKTLQGKYNIWGR